MMALKSKNELKIILLFFPLSLLLLCMVDIYGVAPAETKAEKPESFLIASLDKESVRVGDMVWLTLQYRLPAGARLPEKSEIKGLEELTITDRVKEKNRIKVRFLVDRLGGWKSGSISLTYTDKDGNEKTINAGPVSLTVLSNLEAKPKETGLRPIQDIIPIASKWLTYMTWAAALAGLFFIIAVLTWWYRKRQSRDIAPEVIEPPHIRAGKEIDRLEEEGLFEKGKVKAFYFTLSEILRRYMESIRHFPAAEYTTEEIAQHLHNNEEDRKILPLLRQADLVKFADTVPTPARRDEDIRMARSYIRETIFVVENVPAGLETLGDT